MLIRRSVPKVTISTTPAELRRMADVLEEGYRTCGLGRPIPEIIHTGDSVDVHFAVNQDEMSKSQERAPSAASVSAKQAGRLVSMAGDKAKEEVLVFGRTFGTLRLSREEFRELTDAANAIDLRLNR